MKLKNLSRNYKIALTGLFSALCVLLAFTPFGYLKLTPFIHMTIVHIPALVVTVLGGLVPGIVTGLVFGLSSIILNSINPGAWSLFFSNPMVSIVPRMMFPVMAWLAFRALNMIPHMPKTVSAGISAAVGTLFNTIFVMGSIYIFYASDLVSKMAGTFAKYGYNVDGISGFKMYLIILVSAILSNGLLEMAGAVVITVAVAGSTYIVKGRKSKFSKLDEESQE